MPVDASPARRRLVVLGTALANLVSLVLVRANERRAELSIRVAIGASRLTCRQIMVESLRFIDRQWSRVDVCNLGHIHRRALGPSSIPRVAEVSV